MNVWKTACLALLVCSAMAGCQSGGNQELLERDLRKQEDAIFHLQGHLEEYKQRIELLRQENAALRKEAGGGPALEGTPPRAPRTRTRPPRSSGATQEPGVEIPSAPNVELPSTEGPATPDTTPPRNGTPAPNGNAPAPGGEAPPFEPPTISPPDGSTPEGQRRTTRRADPSASTEATPTEPGALELPLPAGKLPAPEEIPISKSSDFVPTKLVLNKLLTGGHDRDHIPGDEGVLVALEPRNEFDVLVRAEGAVSIVLLDPAESGQAKRYARWDFVPDDVAQHYQENAVGKNFQFELSWPEAPPAHNKLLLHVRFTRTDGKMLEASQAITVDLRNQTPADKDHSHTEYRPASKTRLSIGGRAGRPRYLPQEGNTNGIRLIAATAPSEVPAKAEVKAASKEDAAKADATKADPNKTESASAVASKPASEHARAGEKPEDADKSQPAADATAKGDSTDAKASESPGDVPMPTDAKSDEWSPIR